jgi:hypothetical protein
MDTKHLLSSFLSLHSLSLSHSPGRVEAAPHGLPAPVRDSWLGLAGQGTRRPELTGRARIRAAVGARAGG